MRKPNDTAFSDECRRVRRNGWSGDSLLQYPNHHRAPDGIKWRAIVVSIESEHTETGVSCHHFELILFDERELHRPQPLGYHLAVIAEELEELKPPNDW